MSSPTPHAPQRCIVVVPVFNESATIDTLIKRITDTSTGGWTLIAVDDGCNDDTVEQLRRTANEIDRSQLCIHLVTLSRNFGHHRAILAGLDAAVREAQSTGVGRIAVIDADLQDRPEDLRTLLDASADHDVAYAVRASRQESVLFQLAARLFYKALARWARSPVPPNAGTYSVLSLRAARTMLDNADENVFFPGLRAWVGYSQTPVPLDRDARGDGRSRVGIRGLVRLAIGALFGYSRLPLHLMVLISAASLVLSAIATIAMVILKATGQVAVEGIPLIVVLILFSLSVLGVFLTILAYMVSRNPAPTQVRSLFVIADESCLN